MRGFGLRRLNHAADRPGRTAGGDIWRAIRLQNLCLFVLLFVILSGGSVIFAALILRPVPVLLADKDGRFIGHIEYQRQPPITEAQLESVSKRFVAHYLSQNSATVYSDAEIALAAMCPALRLKTQKEWIEGGRLAEIIQRVQISRVIFTEFNILKYLNTDDIQVSLLGKVLISDQTDVTADIQNNSGIFRLELAMRQVPISERNYLGIEVCSVQFL